MKLSTLSLVPIAASMLCAQSPQDWPISRDGLDWTQSTPEQVVTPFRNRLVINTNARVIVRGTNANQLTWKLKQKVRARSEEGARRLLGDIGAQAEPWGNQTRLTVMPRPIGNVTSELEILVPSKMALVAVGTQSGSIEIYDVEGDVQASTYSGLIQMDRVGGNVLQAQTGGGDITFGKIGGYVVRCSTGAGTVQVGSSGGPVTCATAGGGMSVGQAGGALTLTSGGGDIRVDKAAGPLRAESAAGMVQVRSGSGPLNITSMMGGIVAELMAGARLENSFLSADSGDITVFIPSNLAVTVMARNRSTGISQQVSTEFPELRPDTNRLFRAPFVLQGALNGGGPVLMIDAGSGSIYLRRLK